MGSGSGGEASPWFRAGSRGTGRSKVSLGQFHSKSKMPDGKYLSSAFIGTPNPSTGDVCFYMFTFWKLEIGFKSVDSIVLG